MSKFATAIGSMPHKNVSTAIEFIFKNFKDIPFWPQMTNISFTENMYVQFSEGLPNIVIEEEKEKLFFDISDRIKSDEFFENIDNLEYFKISEEYARGFYGFIDYLEKKLPTPFALKGQITGPITFGLKVPDKRGRPSIYNDELSEIIKFHLAKKAIWQCDKLKKYCKNIIIFIDEPYLSSVGSAYVQIDRKFIIENFNYMISEIKKTGAVVGMHCCADVDWTILFETDVEIISFDAYSYFQEFALYPEYIEKFLERGGIIAYGIVPASEEITKETKTSLVKKLNGEFHYLIKAGLQEKRIYSQFLITPSCGVGSQKNSTAEKILELTSKISLCFE